MEDPKPDINFYPMNDIPYDAYCRLLDIYLPTLIPFGISTMEKDLSKGHISTLVYWYPTYVSSMYGLADEGKDYIAWLNSFHPFNSVYFLEIFKSTAAKLDKIKSGKIKSNHVSEMIVKIKN